LDVKYHTTATDFLAQATRYFVRNEAKYGLIMGIARAVEENPNRYGKEKPWFCTVNAGHNPYTWLGANMLAAALRTPPFMVVVAHVSGSFDLTAEQLVIAVSRQYKAVPGVVGDKGLADRFAARWRGQYRLKITDTQAQRVYKLVKVNDVPDAPGKIRLATKEDEELIKMWSHGFHIDCFGENSKVPESDFSKAIPEEYIYIWEDGGEPVSMAKKSRPTDKGMTVGGVYTPPEFRRKGYATSCVAELSRNILRSGYKLCTLYTDLANPTSNSIYKKIGYTEVCDSVQHTFGPKE
jgi:uncharacterized protein